MATKNDQYSEKETKRRMDDALRRAKPFTPKTKLSPSGPTTKADHAALKRADKTVIKRMRKR